MSTWAKKTIGLALCVAIGFAEGCYFANNDPDMITLVGMGIAGATTALSFSCWVAWTERVHHDDQRD